jgi:tetratricopeptide (TPR) repeat protein
VVPDHLFRKAERWLRKHAKGVIASLLLLSLTAAALLWATVAISREKTIVENLNQNLEIEQKKTNASRGVSSDMLDHLVGYVFDDRLSQVPDSYALRKAILAEFVNEIEEPNDGYLARDPEDWNLKLDLVRILTRLANLQRVQEPEQAQLQWDKVDGLIASAKGVSDRNLERTNWQLAEADSKLYYSEFQFEVKQDFDRAQALCDEALEISDEIIRRDGVDDEFRLLQARAILLKSTLFNQQKRYKESLDQTQSAIRILDEVLGDLLTKQSLSEQEERNLQEHVMATLVYMLGLQHRCDSLQGLDRRSELEQALVEGVGVSKRALVNPIAKTDASRFALANLTKLISIASKDGRLDQADAYYKDACWWVEQNLGNTDLADLVLTLEIVRAKTLSSTDVSAGEASLGRASQMIESMRPSPTEDRRAILEVFLGQEIDYLDAKLALASAKGEQQVVEEIRRKLGEIKQRQEQILHK